MDNDEWDWMRSSNILGAGVSFTTIAGQANYPLGIVGSDFNSDFAMDFGFQGGTVGIDPEKFGKWDRDSFRNYTTASGFNDETFMDEVRFDRWRNGYMLGAQRRVQTRPCVIAVAPDQSLCLGPPPNGQYTVTGDYWVAPSEMANDTDLPTGLPTRFHMLIVYRAMMKYGGYESAPEVYQRGSEENAGMYAQLLALRAPRISFAGALA